MIIDERLYLEYFDDKRTTDEEVDAFLEHYGVKGMRWGVTRDNLRSNFNDRQERIRSTKAATLEARAAKTNIRIGELNKEINALPSGFKSVYKRSILRNELELNENQSSKDTKKAKKIRESRLTPTQKKLLIGAAVVGGVLAASYLASKVDHETIAAAIRRAQSEEEFGSVFKIDENLASPDLSADDILKNIGKSVNPNYASQGGQMNCRRATFTHELRRRGFDVQATTSPMGRAQNETGLVNALIKGDKNPIRSPSLSAMLNREGTSRARPNASDTRTYDAFTERVADISSLRERLATQPNRARGEVVFEESGFAHSMAYEVINGTPHIFDSQKGISYPTTTAGLESLVSKWGTPRAMEITRLDDVDLDLVWLSRWAENSGS